MRPRQRQHSPNITHQPVRIVPDAGIGYTFELNHVYVGTSLDHAMSYWKVTETSTRSSRRLTYASARQNERKLKFEEFSALNTMRDQLMGLFPRLE